MHECIYAFMCDQFKEEPIFFSPQYGEQGELFGGISSFTVPWYVNRILSYAAPPTFYMLPL